MPGRGTLSPCPQANLPFPARNERCRRDLRVLRSFPIYFHHTYAATLPIFCYIGLRSGISTKELVLGGSKFESPSNSVGNSIFGTVLTEQLELVTGWNPNRIRRNCWVYKFLGQ